MIKHVSLYLLEVIPFHGSLRCPINNYPSIKRGCGVHLEWYEEIISSEKMNLEFRFKISMWFWCSHSFFIFSNNILPKSHNSMFTLSHSPTSFCHSESILSRWFWTKTNRVCHAAVDCHRLVSIFLLKGFERMSITNQVPYYIYGSFRYSSIDESVLH